VVERRDEVARVVQVLAAVGATVGGDAHLVTLRIIPGTEKFYFVTSGVWSRVRACALCAPVL
jgi:hypothetical protein